MATSFEVGDRVRIKVTGSKGEVTMVRGPSVYVLLDKHEGVRPDNYPSHYYPEEIEGLDAVTRLGELT